MHDIVNEAINTSTTAMQGVENEPDPNHHIGGTHTKSFVHSQDFTKIPYTTTYIWCFGGFKQEESITDYHFYCQSKTNKLHKVRGRRTPAEKVSYTRNIL